MLWDIGEKLLDAAAIVVIAPFIVVVNACIWIKRRMQRQFGADRIVG